jgi:hypothetical protein
VKRARAAALGIALLPAVPAAWAAGDVRVGVSVLPRGTVYETSEIRLEIKIEGDSIPEVTSPSLPSMTNLRIAGGPSTSRSSSYSFVQGRVSASNTLVLTYFLTAGGPGAAEIPPFDVTVGGTAYRTQALRFQVTAGRGGPAPPGGPVTGRRGAGGEDDEEAGDLADVFLQSKPSATSVWSGQSFVLEIMLFSAAPVQGFAWTDLPSLPGLWSEEIPVDPDRERKVVTMNGRTYHAFPVARRLLVPTSSGTLTIPPFSAQVQVRRPGRDPFGAFFALSPFATLARKTGAVKLDVKPLPEMGRPAAFSGAVGSYRMQVTADRSSVSAGDAVAVRATVEGSGSLQGVGPPRLAAPPDVKVYDPKVVDESAGGPLKMSARKTWEWVIVPLAPGALRLPPPEFAYFDASAGSYRELRGELAEIAVLRGASTPDLGVARGEVQTTARDIAFVKARRGALESSSVPVHRTGWFLALALLPLFLVPAGIFAGRRRERYLSDRGFARARRAARAAARRLERASARAGESATAFHEEVAGALVDYVADRANRSAAGLTYDQLEEILAAKGASPELRRRYRGCLESCDFARYVPDSGRPQARSDMVAEARALVAALEGVA